MEEQDIDNFINQFEQLLSKRQIIIIGKREIAYGTQIFIEDLECEQFMVNIYKGKYGISCIPSNKTSRLYYKISDIIKKINKKIDVPFNIYVGTDESGKGDYFGPLVIAGFLNTRETDLKLYEMGIKDSKKLTDSEVCKLCKSLHKRFKENCIVYSIEPLKYNELYSHFKLERKNLNYLLGWGHARVIEKFLEQNCNIEGVIADKFGSTEYISKTLFEKGKNIKLIQITKGENDMAVAAASILARYEFLKWLEKYSEKYNFNIPRGSGEEVVNAAYKIANDTEIMEIKKLVKLHFKTTKLVLEKYHKERSD